MQILRIAIVVLAAGLSSLPRPTEAQCCGDCDRSGIVQIDELVRAVSSSLEGCIAEVTPTPSPVTGCVVLPSSGQRISYPSDRADETPGPVPVPDDGQAPSGEPLRYADNGDGTVTDLNTGLMWEKKCSDCGALHAVEGRYVWSGRGQSETIWDWLDDLNQEGGSGFAGYRDWRVPNVKELQSIVDYGRCRERLFGSACADEGTIDPVFGPTGAGADYWTVTTYAPDTTSAWIVNFFSGVVVTDGKDYPAYVRAVRSASMTGAGN